MQYYEDYYQRLIFLIHRKKLQLIPLKKKENLKHQMLRFIDILLLLLSMMCKRTNDEIFEQKGLHRTLFPCYSRVN